MSEPAITSLAILKVNWDRGHDYVENFVPFAGESLRVAPQDEVSLPQLQASIAEIFGLKIPQGALQTILRRASRHGYVTRTSGILRRNSSALASLDISTVKVKVLRQHEALVLMLIAFCKNRFKIEWSPDAAEAALLSYLQQWAAPILAAAVEGNPIPAPATQVKHADLIVNRFIIDLHSSDPQGFEYLETIVKGSMLASVLYFPDLGGVTQKFDRVEVYLDTPLLLRALGLAGPSIQAPYQELLDLLYQLNARLMCFQHTFDEIGGVLDAGARALRNSPRTRQVVGDTIEHFITAGYRPSDVELIIARLEESLRALRVRVRPAPPHTPRLGLDEPKFEGILKAGVGYLREQTMQRDIDSLTAIYRLRHGAFPRRVESCNAIFVTTNARLAKASLRFFTEEFGGAAGGSVPHCTLDHILTTLSWLKSPVRAPDLPRKRVIADSYAAINPPDALWKRYVEEIDRLRQKGNITDDDYHELRFSIEARVALTELTFGEVGGFTEGTVEEVRKRARAAIMAEAEATLAAERERTRDAEQRAAASEAKAVASEARAETQHLAQIQRLQSYAVRTGGLVGRLAMYGGTAAVMLGVALALPQPFPALPEQWRKLGAPLILAIFSLLGVLTIANISVGTTLNSIVRQLEVSVSRQVERILLRLAGL